MKKWSGKLMIATLLLSSIPYSLVGNDQAAAAEEISQADQETVQEMSPVEEAVEEAVEESDTTETVEIPSSEQASKKTASTVETEVAIPAVLEPLESIESADGTDTLPPTEIAPMSTADFVITSDGVGTQPPSGNPIYEFSNWVHFKNYSGTLGTGLSYQLQLIDLSNNGVLATTSVIPYEDSGNTVDLTTTFPNGIPTNGKYVLSINVTIQTQFGTTMDSIIVFLNYDKVTAKAEVTNPTNPSSSDFKLSAVDGLDKDRPNATIEWEIRDSTGNPVASGPGSTVPQSVIDGLDNGNYTIVNKSKDVTDLNTNHAKMQDEATAPFTIERGKVIENHILLDDNGNPVPGDPLSTNETKGNYGADYQTNPRTDIPGYVLVAERTEGNVNGQYQQTDQVVNYYYKKIETTVIVVYKDENGKEIHPSEKITDKYGTDYTTTQKDIPGYELVTVVGTTVGKHGETDTTVEYIYKKKPSQVIVHHVDKDGNELASDETKNGLYSDPYATGPASIPGYMVIEVPKNANGKYAVGPTEVTYVYAKITPPTVDPTLEGANVVTGTGVPNKQVVVTFPDGSTVTVDVDANGKWSAPVPNGVQLKKGDKIDAVTYDPLTKMTSTTGTGPVIPLDTVVDPLTPDPDPGKQAPTKTTPTTTPTNTTPTNNTNTTARDIKRLPNTGEENSQGYMMWGMLVVAAVFSFFKRSRNRFSGIK